MIRTVGAFVSPEGKASPWAARMAAVDNPLQLVVGVSAVATFAIALAVQSRQKSRPAVARLDHLVLTVRSLPKTIEFYTQVLGMHEVTFGDGRKALHFGSQKLNLHPADRVLDPNVKHATPGSADLCFLVEGSLDEWMKVLSDRGIPIVLGPVNRTGATGPIRSIYIYDPDQNLLELATPER